MKTETEKIVSRKFSKFGTEVDLQLILKKESNVLQAEEVLDAALDKLDSFEKIFSRFKKESELSKLNSKILSDTNVSEELQQVIELCLDNYEKTLGYFDPRIIEILEDAGYDDDFSKISLENNLITEKQTFKRKLSEDIEIKKGKIKIACRLDLAGIAKGWFVDKIAELFLRSGFENFVVDIGGDMYFSGRGPKEKAWYIDIEGVNFEKLMLKISAKGIATSGIGKRKWEKNSQRFHHLINPINPEHFSFQLKSATVIADKTYEADVLAKAIFLMGKEKGFKFAKENKIACAILDYKGNVFVSNEMKKYIFN